MSGQNRQRKNNGSDTYLIDISDWRSPIAQALPIRPLMQDIGPDISGAYYAGYNNLAIKFPTATGLFLNIKNIQKPTFDDAIEFVYDKIKVFLTNVTKIDNNIPGTDLNISKFVTSAQSLYNNLNDAEFINFNNYVHSHEQLTGGKLNQPKFRT